MDEITLPGKLPFQSQYADTNRSAKVVLNANRFDVLKVIKNVHKHELKFFAKTKKDEERDLSRGKQNDVHRELRQKLHWGLYQQMISTNPQFFRIENQRDQYKFVYDRGINFYSIDQLFETLDSSSRKEFELTKDGLTDELLAYLGSMGNICARLLYVEVLDLQQPVVTEEGNRVVAHFYDILTNQMLFKNESHIFFPSKAFSKSSNIEIKPNRGKEPRILKEGISKNIRFVGNSMEDAMAVLQVDAKKAAFFPEQPLLSFIVNFLEIGEPTQILQRNNLARAESQVKGLVVTTKHMRRNRIFEIKGLTEKSAKQQTFKQDDQDVFVADYYQIKHNINLLYPGAPCAIERISAKEFAFYPLELLSIMPGQRVSLKKQNPRLTQEMIRMCRTMPSELQRNCQKQMEDAVLVTSNQYFSKFNVKIREKLEPEGRIMFPPAIAYNENEANRMEPNTNGEFYPKWALNQNDMKRFIQPCALTKNELAAVIVEGGVSENDCGKFLDAFINNASNRGVRIEKPDIISAREIGEMFIRFKNKGVRFIMYFSADKNDIPTHQMFKVMEAEHKIVTQHVTKLTMTKAISRNQMVLDNLLQKFNLKNGGVNHGLFNSSAFMHQSKISGDLMSTQWFGPHRMFFGFDMSHTGPQTHFERQATKAGDQSVKQLDPTVVGMAYTISPRVVDMRGDWWMQEARLTTILHAANRIVAALKNFEKRNSRFPTQLIVFRGGVSEGAYAAVAMEEVQQFKEAFQILQAETNGTFRPPNLTILVCQRASNYRVIPARINPEANALQQNCQPGTVIDQNVMNPNLTEFLLVGHYTIQGTAQPLRCTVLYDDCPQRIPLQELEYITYSLCYAHGIVTSPVSVPAHLYAASELAKRGRNNFKMRDEFDAKVRQQIQAGESDQDYHIRLDKLFSPAGLDSKFWA